jgi:hypothetical protein
VAAVEHDQWIAVVRGRVRHEAVAVLLEERKVLPILLATETNSGTPPPIERPVPVAESSNEGLEISVFARSTAERDEVTFAEVGDEAPVLGDPPMVRRRANAEPDR